MSTLDDLVTIIREDVGVAPYLGYPPTNAPLPYAVVRPLSIEDPTIAIAGNAIEWNSMVAVYPSAASVEACFNLTNAIMNAVQGRRSGNSTFSVSTGYSGAEIEGSYDSQITVQINQGVLQ